MSSRYPSREAQLRFAEACERYRAAFVAVQDILAQTELGRIPAWVFAIDRMALDDLLRLSPELAEAEHWRRSCRVALNALAQLMALEPEPGELGRDSLNAGSDAAVDDLINSLSEANPPSTVDQPDDDPQSQQHLDVFISIVNYARGGSCIYSNGTFEPMRRTTPRPAPRPAPADSPAPPMALVGKEPRDG